MAVISDPAGAPSSQELAAALATVNANVGLDAPTGAVTSDRLSTAVVNFGGSLLGELPTIDPTGAVPQDIVWSAGGVTIAVPGVNLDGLVPSSTGGIATGWYRPGNQMLQPVESDLSIRLTAADSATRLRA